VRYCGIEVSARPGQQQLVSLHARRTGGEAELVTTFYAPGDVASVTRTVLGFGREAVVAIGAPAGRRLDLLHAASPLRAGLGLARGRYEQHRVCDALLFRRGVPLYSIPSPGSLARRAWEQWIEVGFALHGELDGLGAFRPTGTATLEGAVGPGALRFGRVAESYPDAVFCALLGHRAPPKRTPWGLQQRIAALRLRGVVDADGGLWHRTLDELDACAIAYAAFALADGSAWWTGDAREGVVVLPGHGLHDRYEKLPPPTRQPLA
jgi:hypothetical protein